MLVEISPHTDTHTHKFKLVIEVLLSEKRRNGLACNIERKQNYRLYEERRPQENNLLLIPTIALKC